MSVEAPWTVEAYKTPAGTYPVRGFIASLTDQDEADALALVKLVEEFGNELRQPQSKALGRGLYELRRNQVRIFYMFGPKRRMVTLLHGIVKKQNRIPQGELDLARSYKNAVAHAEARRKKVKR